MDSLRFVNKYKSIRRLNRSICISNTYLDRGFYKIKLKNTKVNSKFTIYRSEYCIKFSLEEVPPHKLLKVLLYCFQEIFFIIQNNKITESGGDGIRIILEARSLKNPINLRSVNLSKSGAQMLIDEIAKTVQSNESLLIDETLKVTFVSTKINLKALKNI